MEQALLSDVLPAAPNDSPLFVLLELERARKGIQLESVELAEIIAVLHPPARFLVFGLGNDSSLWHDLNRAGRTVFIEDDAEWFDRLTNDHPELEAYLACYGTVRESWEDLIDHPEDLRLELPDSVLAEPWDVILVDGPAGYEDGKPGRMKSIFMALQLVRPGGTVIVHDAERPVEAAYCERYLGDLNIRTEISGRALLRIYLIP